MIVLVIVGIKILDIKIVVDMGDYDLQFNSICGIAVIE